MICNNGLVKQLQQAEQSLLERILSEAKAQMKRSFGSFAFELKLLH